MVIRTHTWSSLLWLWIEPALRSNPSWMWIQELIFCNPLRLWVEEVCGPSPLGMCTDGVLAANSVPAPVVTYPDSQSIEKGPSICCNGDMERPHETGFSDLPDDLVAAILANLSLDELARFSRTCSAFQAVCRGQVAQERKTRCDLAVGCLGRERLIYLALIMDRFHKGEPVGPELAEQGKDAEWILVSETIFGKASDRLYNAGDMVVNIRWGTLGNSLIITLPTLMGNLLRLYIRIFLSPDSITIDLNNIGEEEAFDVTEGTAIIHTLLSGDLAPHSPEPGLQSGVFTGRYFFVHHILEENMKIPRATWVPMPLRHTFAAVGLGGARFRNDHIRVFQTGYDMQVGMSLSSGTKLHLWLTVYSTEAFPGFFVRLYIKLMEYLSKFSLVNI